MAAQPASEGGLHGQAGVVCQRQRLLLQGIREHVRAPRAGPRRAHAPALVLLYGLVDDLHRHVPPGLARVYVVVELDVPLVDEDEPGAARLRQDPAHARAHGGLRVGQLVCLRVEGAQDDGDVVAAATTYVPLLVAVPAVEVGALHTVEQGRDLVALRAHTHLHPRPAVGLAAPPAVEPVEAALAEKILALVAEEHRVLLIALHADHHLWDPLGLHLPSPLVLQHEVPIARHEGDEVVHVFHRALLLDGVAVVPQAAPQHVHQVRLPLHVHVEDPPHF
mmetsp:Transcript_515/g.1585  ORF Transcript_515/g.1585 Transcript_515/m.1585 type:complete len:278 (+) Transcript_515:109-942(+)